MKIQVESGKIVKAVKKLDGIEIVVENPEDAKEAINLILRKSDIFSPVDYDMLKDVRVNALQKYETSAVNYKIVFLLDFFFEENVTLDSKVNIIKNIQAFFEKV